MMQQLTSGSDFNTILTFIYVFIAERIEDAKIQTKFSRKAGFSSRLSDAENITIDIIVKLENFGTIIFSPLNQEVLNYKDSFLRNIFKLCHTFRG